METNESRHYGLFLSFKLGKELFAVDVHQSRKILALSEHAMNPKLTSLLLGTIDYENEEIPIINLKSKLGVEESEKPSQACIIVVEIPIDNNVFLVGMLVDSMAGVAKFDSDYFELIQKLSDASSFGRIKELNIINRQPITIIDIKNVLSPEELEDIIISSEDAVIH